MYQYQLPPGEVQFFDASGRPLSSGTVTFYAPNTTTFKDTYQDYQGTILNTNPISLDLGGRAIIFGNGSYRQIVQDRLGNVVWDQFTSTGTQGTPPTVENVTQARALTADGYQYDTLFILGADGGLFWRDASDTTSAEDGGDYCGTIIRDTAYAMLGVWKRSNPSPVNPQWFGAKFDGTTDDSSAINAAYSSANANNYNAVQHPSNSSAKCASAITMFPNKVSTIGDGTTLDFSALVSGYAITFSQSITDANSRNAANKAHPISGLNLIGPGGSVTVTALDGNDHNPITGTPWLAGITFNSVSFQNFYRDVEIGNGAFLWTFNACNFSIFSGSGYDCSIYAPLATNAGENVTFSICFFGKVYGSNVRSLNPNATLYFRGCSSDYTSNSFDVQSGEVDWDGYIEANNDTDYWGKVSGENSVLKISGRISITGNKSSYSLFYSDSTATNGGLVLDVSLQWGTSTYGNLSLISGTGRVAPPRLRACSRTSVHPPIGGSYNIFANGNFESASIAEWTLGGTTPPSRSTTQSHSSTHSLQFPGTSTNTPSASKAIACLPGQYVVGSLWYFCSSITGTSGTFYGTVSYLDSAGAALGVTSAFMNVTANAGTWTFANIYLFDAAPMGTASASISISLFGTASGAPIGYIDDITLAVA